MLETYKAKLHGDHLVWHDGIPDSVLNGETIEVIITVLDETETKELRPIGLAKGEFVVPDDFDDPLPDDILADFEN